jgi:hypothetical protein
MKSCVGTVMVLQHLSAITLGGPNEPRLPAFGLGRKWDCDGFATLERNNSWRAERTAAPRVWSGTQRTEGKVLLTEGKVLLGEPVAMRRPAQVPLARMTFPLTLADGLRAAFADFVSDPLPERLAALMRQLRTECEERLGEANHGASATETSRRIDRRGRR